MKGFIIGIFVGAIFGVVTMALCAASSKEPPTPTNEEQKEAQDEEADSEN